MELGSVIAQAFSSAFAPVTMLYALLGVILGVTVGAIPGLTGDMAIAILLPFVYKVDPSMSLGLLIGIYKGSMFGGSMITETLFQIPSIGYVSYNAMIAGDIPFTMFYLVFIIVLTQVSLIVADIMYAVVDPRVRVN